VDNFQTNGMEGLYGEFAGDNLKALLAIEGSLRSLNTAKGDISSILMNGSLELSNAELQLENISHEKAINHIRSVKVALEAAIRCIQACMSANTGSFIDKSTNVGPAIAISALSIAVAALEEGIFDLERQILDNQEDQTYNEAMLAFIAKLRELSGVFGTIKDAYSEIQASLTTLDQNQNEAAYWWAVGMGLDGDTAGRVFPVNTVMRRRKNTLRIRYQQAAKRARRLAFIARRAIEFRFGVDLSQMTEEMSLVEAPSTWADRVCDMQGFSYDRLRDAFPEDPLLDPELQDSDNYAHWYIGDYVDLLEAFVQSYNQDYPMTDERDVAVVSLRDDIMQARQQCEIPSRNLLVYSGDVGRRAVVEDPATQTTFVRGWVSGGCSENPAAIINCSNSADPAQCVGLDRCLAPVVRDDPDSAFCEEGFCFGNDYGWVMNDPSNPKMGEMPHAADRLRDQPLPLTGNQNGRTVNGENTGYYDQLVTGLTSGDYVLSWWAHEPVDVVTPVDYRVEVLTADGQTLISGTNNPYIAAPRQSWYDTSNPNNESREWLSIYLDAPQDVIVRVHPSDPGLTDDISSSAAFGDVWIWGMQLERLTCDECVAGPGRYYDTGDTNTITREMCPDLDGSVMRQRFEYKCVCVGFEGGICPEDSYGDSYRRCYWEFPFEIMLDRIERGDLIPSNNIAIGNFNYRHEALAVNVVGTGVTDCSDPTAPPNCYTNAFLPYTLEHQGWVQVKNHNRQTMEYEMPTARVEHGKGLTAEVVLTNPLTGSHSQLLTDYWKDGLRGRPLQGEYLLRIWDTGELSWSKIEDIQIVWKYRYWTQMGSSY
jgi:hypothetical protein